MSTRLATIGVGAALAVFLVLWAATSCPESEARQRAEAFEDSTRIARDSLKTLKDSLEVEKARTDSAEAELEAQRERTRTIIERERTVQTEGEERFASAGEDLLSTLDSIAFVAPETAPLVDAAKMQVRDRDREFETVVGALEAQMRGVVALQESTDSARVTWRAQALTAESALEKAEAGWQFEFERAEAWKAEANPGFLEGLRTDLPKLGAAVAVTAVVLLVAQ